MEEPRNVPNRVDGKKCVARDQARAKLVNFPQTKTEKKTEYYGSGTNMIILDRLFFNEFVYFILFELNLHFLSENLINCNYFWNQRRT